MTKHKLHLITLPDLYAVCRLDKDAPVPAWAGRRITVRVSRAGDALTRQDRVFCHRG